MVVLGLKLFMRLSTLSLVIPGMVGHLYARVSLHVRTAAEP